MPNQITVQAKAGTALLFVRAVRTTLLSARTVKLSNVAFIVVRRGFGRVGHFDLAYFDAQPRRRATPRRNYGLPYVTNAHSWPRVWVAKADAGEVRPRGEAATNTEKAYGSTRRRPRLNRLKLPSFMQRRSNACLWICLPVLATLQVHPLDTARRPSAGRVLGGACGPPTPPKPADLPTPLVAPNAPGTPPPAPNFTPPPKPPVLAPPLNPRSCSNPPPAPNPPGLFCVESCRELTPRSKNDCCRRVCSSASCWMAREFAPLIRGSRFESDWTTPPEKNAAAAFALSSAAFAAASRSATALADRFDLPRSSTTVFNFEALPDAFC